MGENIREKERDRDECKWALKFILSSYSVLNIVYRTTLPSTYRNWLVMTSNNYAKLSERTIKASFQHSSSSGHFDHPTIVFSIIYNQPAVSSTHLIWFLSSLARFVTKLQCWQENLILCFFTWFLRSAAEAPMNLHCSQGKSPIFNGLTQ